MVPRNNSSTVVESSATPPPIFASIENDSFVAKFVLKHLRSWVSADNSWRSSRNIEMSLFEHTFIFCAYTEVVSGSVPPNKFQVQILSGSRDTTLGWFIHFLAGPARMYTPQVIWDEEPIRTAQGPRHCFFFFFSHPIHYLRTSSLSPFNS